MKPPNRVIKLDEEYYIECDNIGVSLNYKATKERIDSDSLEVIEYKVNERFYFLTVAQALDRYKDKVMEQSDDLKSVLKKLKEVEVLIKNIK